MEGYRKEERWARTGGCVYGQFAARRSPLAAGRSQLPLCPWIYYVQKSKALDLAFTPLASGVSLPAPPFLGSHSPPSATPRGGGTLAGLGSNRVECVFSTLKDLDRCRGKCYSVAARPLAPKPPCPWSPSPPSPPPAAAASAAVSSASVCVTLGGGSHACNVELCEIHRRHRYCCSEAASAVSGENRADTADTDTADTEDKRAPTQSAAAPPSNANDPACPVRAPAPPAPTPLPHEHCRRTNKLG